MFTLDPLERLYPRQEQLKKSRKLLQTEFTHLYSFRTTRRSTQDAMEAPKIDRLSSLAPELLDYIFELAASTHSLSTVPPLKSLLPYHERALYRFVKLDRLLQLDKLQQTLDTHSQKARLVRHLSVLSPTTDSRSNDVQRLFGRLANLVEVVLNSEATQVYTMHADVPRIVQHQFSSLQILRAPRYILPSSVLQVWSRMPNLREVELASVSHETGLSFVTVDQVTKLHVTDLGSVHFHRIAPVSLLRFFPSAKLISLDLTRYEDNETPALRNYITPLAESLVVLRLRDNPSITHANDSNVNLSDFSHLQELHLGRHFAGNRNLTNQLLHLSNLVSLSLDHDGSSSELEKLLQGSERLPRLRKLSLKYGPFKEGQNVNLKRAEEEDDWEHYDEDGDGTALIRDFYNFDEMGDWELLPHIFETSGGLSEIKELEEFAREAGLIVKSNYADLRRAFHRQLMEYFSRGIVAAYLNGNSSFVKDAIEIAETHKMRLPQIHVDFSQKMKKEELEAFKVNMSQAVGGEAKTSSYNLRYKK